ncbi:MAG: class I SAM-dependent methyltransferase [Methanophagales archaeon]|nr:class I SAM-dependent methyltransferase [Methanophagales archaeon]
MGDNLISRILREKREKAKEKEHKAEGTLSDATRTITVTAEGTTLRYYDSATHHEEIITDHITKSDSNYTAEFEWLLQDKLHAPFDLFAFEKYPTKLVYRGDLNGVPTTITLQFPAGITHCHYHVMWSGECQDSECVVYVPTPEEETRTALQKAKLKPGETFVELGCGDGRNLKIAASEFGAKCIGYELNHERAEQARKKTKGLPVTIKEETFMNAARDLAKADCVYVYLLQSVNQAVKPLLEENLKHGARVISRHFTFEGWTPNFEWNNIYFYQF